MKTVNDFAPETTSLLNRLVAAGFRITRGDNGEDRFNFVPGELSKFVEELVACDESRVYLIAPDGKKVWIYLVLGNEPGVIASDYVNHDVLDAEVDAHYVEWSEKEQPTKRI